MIIACVELTWLETIHSWYPWKMLSKQNQASIWNTCSRTRHQSGTLIAEPDTSLEHCLDSNNTYTSYSSGHPISIDPLPLSPSPSTSVWIFYLTPLPASTECHKCVTARVNIWKRFILNWVKISFYPWLSLNILTIIPY